MKNRKSIIVSCLVSLLVIALSITSLVISNNFLYEDKTNEEILAYVELTEEVTTEEITTTTTTTTTTTEPTTVATTRVTTVRVVEGLAERKGNVSQSLINIANEELNKIPSNVLNKFESMGWHIYITDENIAKNYFDGVYSSVQGVTIYTERIILIENRESAIRNSVIHEMGHFLDSVTRYSSYSDEFNEIYNNEVNTFKSRIVNSSCVRDTAEFFAETFFYMYKNPSKCTEGAYNYVLEKVNSI
jgi:hypothetical protein